MGTLKVGFWINLLSGVEFAKVEGLNPRYQDSANLHWKSAHIKKPTDV
jgi:hypothetical protein